MTCELDLPFCDFYLSLLFNFKIGLSLGLSCLMSSMFIIILVIRVIKTTYFDNTILMAELEGKFLKVGGLFLSITAQVLVKNHKIFGKNFWKG